MVGKELSLCFSILDSEKDNINPLRKLATRLPDILRNLLPLYTHKPTHALSVRVFLEKPPETTGEQPIPQSSMSAPGPFLNWAFNPKLALIVFRLQSWVGWGVGDG